MNGSASGSNTGANNGQSGMGVAPMADDNSGNDPALDGASGANGVCTEQMRFARREAALNKFRQKRKERCFEKKVCAPGSLLYLIYRHVKRVLTVAK